MKRILIAAAATVIMSVPARAGVNTASEFAAACPASPASFEWCTTFLSAVVWGYRVGQDHGADRTICIPADVTHFDTMLAVRKTIAYIRSHPNIEDAPAPQVIVYEISRLYPCD